MTRPVHTADTPAPNAPSTELAEALRTLSLACLARAPESIEAIPAGLGPRHFYRLRYGPGGSGGPASAIARVDRPEDPSRRPAGVAPEPPLEPLRSFLEDAGIPVPRSYGQNRQCDITLLEDVGDTTLENITGCDRSALYRRACLLIPPLQQLSAPPGTIPAFGRRLDASLLRYKAEQLIQHGLPFALERPTRPSEQEVVRAAFDAIAAECAQAPHRLAHRDYKAANIHVRPVGEAGSLQLVLIDLQGAFLAPPEYDLVCLLGDLHGSQPEKECREHRDATRLALPDPPEAEFFERRFHLLTLTRVGKDFSRFIYASTEAGDSRYTRFLPRGAAILRRAAAFARPLDARFARLADLLEALPEAPRIAQIETSEQEVPACGP